MDNTSDYVWMPYHFVPPCPRCGNPVTGRYVRMWISSIQIVEEALENGELVKPAYDDRKRNYAFCAECGYDWYSNVQQNWLQLKEFNQQKALRNTEKYLQLIKLLRQLRKEEQWFNLF